MSKHSSLLWEFGEESNQVRYRGRPEPERVVARCRNCRVKFTSFRYSPERWHHLIIQIISINSEPPLFQEHLIICAEQTQITGSIESRAFLFQTDRHSSPAGCQYQIYCNG